MRRLFHCVAPASIGLAIATATSHSLFSPLSLYAESPRSLPAKSRTNETIAQLLPFAPRPGPSYPMEDRDADPGRQRRVRDR